MLNEIKLLMEFSIIIKIFLILILIIGIYAVARNLDIIKIILIYWKDLILRRK